MLSNRVPTTNCVYFFDDEFKQLQKRLGEPTENLCCYLYGLWTHSSNIVVHLVVSSEDEFEHAKTHRLNCVGYVAVEYTKNLYKMVNRHCEISSEREHVIVDVDETKKCRSLKAYGSHPDIFQGNGDPFRNEDRTSKGKCLTVNKLPNESPFRRDLRKKNGENTHGNSCWNTQINGDKTANGILNSSLIKSTVNKITARLSDDGEVNKIVQGPSLFLQFNHHGKKWKVELNPNKAGEDRIWADIFFSEDVGTNSMHVFSQKLITSQEVIGAIQEVCQCKICKNH